MARNKSTNLQIRMSEKLKFALNLVGRQEKRNLTQIVEEAIEARADSLKIGTPWDVLWDEDEGVRMLNLLALPGYKADEDEREIKQFTQHHSEYFYSDKAGTVPNRTCVSVLWPKLRHYMHLWRNERHVNAQAAAEAMEVALKAAKVKPPKVGK